MPQPSPCFCRYHAALKASPLWDAKVKRMVAGTPTITNHRGVHFHEAPAMFGVASAGSTVAYECAHKFLKRLWLLTQRRQAKNDVSVAAKLSAAEKRSVAHLAPGTEPAQAGAPQRPRRALVSLSSTSTLVGTHPAKPLSIRAPGTSAAGAVPLSSQPSCLLWTPDLFDWRADTPASQAKLLQSELDRYFHAAQSTAAPYTVSFRAGVRLVDSVGDSTADNGIARASPCWNGAPRYNVCRVLLASGASAASSGPDPEEALEFGFARLALIMRVTHNRETHELVLVRWYESAPRPQDEHAVYARLGPLLQYVPRTSADAWQIFRSDALHDVWKLEQDARDPSRYFVNQFIAANASPENGADGDSAPA